MHSVGARYQAMEQVQPGLLLYALVDGYQYEQHMGERIPYQPATDRPLFFGTEYAALADAGPWLINIADITAQVPPMDALERALPSVSWLITPVGLDGLAQLLQLKLDARLPDGRRVLLRFYDPRVLGNLNATLDRRQRLRFFDCMDEWHFLRHGERIIARYEHA